MWQIGSVEEHAGCIMYRNVRCDEQGRVFFTAGEAPAAVEVGLHHKVIGKAAVDAEI